jgi:hypothetical protein
MPITSAPRATVIKVGGHQASSRLDGFDHDRALFLGAQARRPGGGEAARLACLPRDAVPDGQPDAGEDGRTSAAWRRAVLSQPHQGRGRCGLLHRLGRPWRGGSPRSPRSCRTIIAAKRLGEGFPLAAWSRWWAMRSWTRATSTNAAGRLEERPAQIAGGSSTITGSRSTGWCAKACSSDREDLRGVRLGRGDRQIRRLQRAAFEEPGGKALRDWIESCPNQDYSALTFMGGAVWRAPDGRPWRPGRRDCADRAAQRRRTGTP